MRNPTTHEFMGTDPSECEGCGQDSCDGSCTGGATVLAVLPHGPRLVEPKGAVRTCTGTPPQSSTPPPPSSSAAKKKGGIFIVNNAMHDEACRLGKNARLVSFALGWHMGPRHEAVVGVERLVGETPLCRMAVVSALKVACGPAGVFDKKRRGLGNCNLYSIKPSVMSKYSDIWRNEK